MNTNQLFSFERNTSLPQKRYLRPALNLKSIFESCHNFIYANEGLRKEQIFNEFLKLIFLKIMDERDPNSICQFAITNEEQELLRSERQTSFDERISELLEKAKGKYDVFAHNETINLKAQTLAFVVRQLQEYSLSKTPVDVKGTAFQTFVYANARGERGEFFTPYPVISLCVAMINPKESESVLDPACGSGAFLTESIHYCWKKIDSNSDLSPNDKDKLKAAYAKNRLTGIEFNPDVARIAKMYMVFFGNGHDNILTANSLQPFKILDSIAKRTNRQDFKPESFDIILTNPPFGTRGKITDRNILAQFELGHKWRFNETERKWEVTERLLAGQAPEFLFVERCLQLLRNNGRMAIVLPDGELANQSSQYFRQFLYNNVRIISVLSLPAETFSPFGNSTKTSVLFVQKMARSQLEKIESEDYWILMLKCEKIGYDKRGTIIPTKDNKGRWLNSDGNIVSKPEDAAIDTDITSILDAFETFKKESKLGF